MPAKIFRVKHVIDDRLHYAVITDRKTNKPLVKVYLGGEFDFVDSDIEKVRKRADGCMNVNSLKAAFPYGRMD